MKNQRYGKIITVASQAGRALSTLAGPNYASAKAGAIAFTRHVANESAPFGINVNAIAPGVVYSGPRIEQIWNSFSEDKQQQIIQAIPAGRLASNEDISAAVLFLAGDESSYIIGATLDINGGRWML
jgi:NAD(P)-dependent dehydrogenase (short-subunit alcohol dehydrogenase family)